MAGFGCCHLEIGGGASLLSVSLRLICRSIYRLRRAAHRLWADLDAALLLHGPGCAAAGLRVCSCLSVGSSVTPPGCGAWILPPLSFFFILSFSLLSFFFFHSFFAVSFVCSFFYSLFCSFFHSLPLFLPPSIPNVVWVSSMQSRLLLQTSCSPWPSLHVKSLWNSWTNRFIVLRPLALVMKGLSRPRESTDICTSAFLFSLNVSWPKSSALAVPWRIYGSCAAPGKTSVTQRASLRTAAGPLTFTPYNSVNAEVSIHILHRFPDDGG